MANLCNARGGERKTAHGAYRCILAAEVVRAWTMRLAILMPTYNEGERLDETLQKLSSYAETKGHFVEVFLVDDGGKHDVKPSRLPPDSDRYTVTLMRHPINLGQGGALETARRKALRAPIPHDAYVTMDSDGQHSVDDLDTFCVAISEGYDAVFGNRFGGESNVPRVRSWVLFGARLFERVLTGLALSDAHNGYRAFSHKGIQAVTITQSRMAHATEIKQCVARAGDALRLTEVPVTIRYTADTLQKGQSSLGALQILRDLLFGYVFRSARR
jgi:polyprenyl-phospho-N-acetylgalactosaminyl synthase